MSNNTTGILEQKICYTVCTGTETCRFKAVYTLQALKQHFSNRGRQIFTKRHREKITSISSDQSRHGLHSLFLLSPGLSYNGINAPVRHARNLQNQCCEGRSLQAQLIPKISSISLPFSLASSFYLSLFLLICLIFFILPFFPSRTQLVKKGKGFLFNVGSRRKPESLFPAKPTAGVFYLSSTQSRLVLFETILKCYHSELDASRKLSPSRDRSRSARTVVQPAYHCTTELFQIIK